MKKGSRRLRRMERNHKMRKASSLNMVSLMDIFTILVFFLLVNSSSAPQLPNQKDMALPTSTAQKDPKDTLVLIITPQSLLLQGRELSKIQPLLEGDEEIIEPLLTELEFLTTTKPTSASASNEQTAGLAITIMGDENIPYSLLRKILATCQQANYTEIAFAAHQQKR